MCIFLEIRQEKAKKVFHNHSNILSEYPAKKCNIEITFMFVVM